MEIKRGSIKNTERRVVKIYRWALKVYRERKAIKINIKEQ